MGAIQRMGIASQAQDVFDDQRAGRRMRDLQEQQYRQSIMRDKLMRAVITRAMQMELNRNKPVVAPQQGAIQAPSMADWGVQGNELGGHLAMRQAPFAGDMPEGLGFAKGGMVKAPKFDGIFDAQKVKNGRLPNMFRALNGVRKHQKRLAPHFKGGAQKAMQQIARFAHGGAVRNAPVKPIPMGGLFKTFAKGGLVRGPGTGTSDSIPATINGRQPARLSDGEYVIPAAIVKKKGKAYFDRMIGKKGK